MEIKLIIPPALDYEGGPKKEKWDSMLEELVRLGRTLGAGDVRAISAKEISVEDRLANLCREPKCKNYGLSPSCPPHVGGPSEFRNLLEKYEQAIVVRIVVPSSALFSDAREDIMRLLHQIVAGIEQEAVRMGFNGAKAFAGGSCKNLFCDDYAGCRVLSEKGKCRNPEEARPSMSGFGINVSNLMKVCGWAGDIKTSRAEAVRAPLFWVAGLILVG